MSAGATKPIVEFYRDPGRDTPRRTPALRYMILTAPRTGSSWLAATLAETGEAGVPTEYLHPAVIQAFAQAQGGSFDPERFWAELEPRRTTANGVFGLKLLASQTVAALPAKRREAFAAALLRRCDRVIFLHRRDKVAQAMSWYVANTTRQFQTETAADQARLRQAKDTLAFDAAALGDALAEMIRQDAFAQKLLDQHPGPALTVAYEDLLAAPAAAFARIFDFLGISADPACIETPTYQARDADLEARTEAFRQWLSGTA